MNGKYYGKREIRWHSREKERLEHINKRKEKNESTCGNRPNLGHHSGVDSCSVPFEPVAGTSH
nr:MAG TPA: hypothetical protein [Caudoviricetes sp.]DAV47168.1 MAG TPA: hypothetical protein [Caudoviricetes sp.]